MSDITMEKKLELVQQVRSQYNKNQFDMSNRERILYGRTSLSDESMQPSFARDSMENPATKISFFRLRLFLAVVLFAAVIYFDKSSIEIAGTTTDALFRMISADYYGEVAEFVDTVTESVK